MIVESLPDPSFTADSGKRHWSLDDVPYARIEHARIAHDKNLFGLVAAASFVEITSDVYTRNLMKFCAADDEVVDWLGGQWEHEEVQHGTALRRYVETAWPDFDWETAYRGFLEDYLPTCSINLFAPTPALEMVSRCIVETGTATFYRMLADVSPEPVLRRLATFISRDEVDHYKHFYRYYRRFAGRGKMPGRVAILRTLLARTVEVDAEDAAIAYKHVKRVSEPGRAYQPADYVAFRRSIREMAYPHYRFDMAAKMFLRPLDLTGLTARIAVPLATTAARRLLFN